MTIPQYIESINRRYKAGNTTEHSFRGDLQQLIETLVPGISATNEPKRQTCGAPDYILTKKEIPVGFIEAKDIGDTDLEGKKKTGNKEQFDRYKKSLENLVFTDYLDFHFYNYDQPVTVISIASLQNGTIVALPQNFETFSNLLNNFCSHIGQTIKSSKRLAEMMAGKARLLSDVIERSLLSDEQTQENSTLKEQMNAFKQILIHDITPKAFADVYAQTIAYGMFAARLHDKELDSFSRQEAAEKIPKTNPFLRKLFGYIAGPDIDDRIKWIVDSLVDIFMASNVEEILKNYGKQTRTEDPIIHFYETFLSEYDPKLRKARGVWYTPAPVVNFIVRAVDDILKTEFDLPMGLADNSKTKIKINQQGKTVEQEVHKVQVLDPATGTGTFLAEAIRHIHKNFEGQQGIWSNYVETHLLPRLNGFELLMASYAMAHLQLDLLLTDTGYKPTASQRLRVYLTNSLEESHPDTGTLFANWLSTEANEANHIKRDTPVMVVMGNPPYSVSSSNKGEWIESLTADYKKDLNERNIQPLSDDYIKFIRFGQHFIDKNGSGVLAYISNNSFIDGVIHRQMRKHLLESFDKIYVLDLHGNAKKKEIALDGSVDQNVFDIMQGVSINIFVKTGLKKKSELAQVLHHSLHGLRETKYQFLNDNSLDSLKWNKLDNIAPNFFLVKKNFDGAEVYETGFSLGELFSTSANGIKTQRDDASIFYSKNEANVLHDDFVNLSIEELKKKYGYVDVRDWKVSYAKDDILKNPIVANTLLYRPFDLRSMNYTGKTKGVMGYPRLNIMRHFLDEKNTGLILVSQSQAANLNYFDCVFITNLIADTNMFRRGGPSVFPLYVYPETSTQQTLSAAPERVPNLNMAIVQQIKARLGLTFTNEKETNETTFAPIDILDYIYAVLHSPTYRNKYKEFLKIDFPRVPYPKDAATFWQLVKLGGQLRQIHLLESPVVNKPITKYPVTGDNVVGKIQFVIPTQEESAGQSTNAQQQTGSVFINDSQYFADTPQSAWEFYIGGYQPAQKWLKDRKGRALDFEDILHYQKIIVALKETGRLMKEIDTFTKD